MAGERARNTSSDLLAWSHDYVAQTGLTLTIVSRYRRSQLYLVAGFATNGFGISAASADHPAQTHSAVAATYLLTFNKDER